MTGPEHEQCPFSLPELQLPSQAYVDGLQETNTLCTWVVGAWQAGLGIPTAMQPVGLGRAGSLTPGGVLKEHEWASGQL